MTVRLLDCDANRTWTQADGGLQQARTRMTLAAWRLVEQADKHGLAVHVWGTSHTDIVGTLGHQLTISHKKAPPGRNRLTRVQLCRHDGSTVESRYTLAQAAAWIEGQPRPLRRAPLAQCAAST